MSYLYSSALSSLSPNGRLGTGERTTPGSWRSRRNTTRKTYLRILSQSATTWSHAKVQHQPCVSLLWGNHPVELPEKLFCGSRMSSRFFWIGRYMKPFGHRRKVGDIESQPQFLSPLVLRLYQPHIQSSPVSACKEWSLRKFWWTWKFYAILK